VIMTPLWWRIPAWTAMLAYTIASADGTVNRICTGVLMGVSVLAVQLLDRVPMRTRQVQLIVASGTGLAACYFAHDGLAEVSVFLAAARAPEALDGLALRWFVILDTIAVGVTVGVISDSIPAGLAGVGVPLLAQRAVEHRELIRERDRAQALLAEVQAGREAETQAAALRERGRIARDLHDVLAHSLAGLSVQLQAVRALATRSGAATELLPPLDKAASLARDGLAEARAAVSALRDPIGLGLAELPALIDRHPGAATLHTTGTPGAVDPEAGHAVYRAVQEALTNAARYAPGSPVAVSLEWRDRALDVSVTDDGPAPERGAVTGQGTGLGLAGMAERLAQVGGTVQAGPRPTGPGWQVTLTVPTRDFDLPISADRAPERALRGQSGEIAT